MKNAGGNQTEHKFGAVHKHRMAGVVSTLIPRDDCEVRRQQIDNFAFSFVAPLRAEDCEVHIGLRFYPQMIFQMCETAAVAGVKQKIFYFQFDNARAAS
jgi:hypothetical protein